MPFESFIRLLQERLLQPLPGEVAQWRMAPVSRLTSRQYQQLGSFNPRQSAVLICLYPFQNSIYTLLMLRPTEQGAHSGQVSFPGGRFEETDTDLQATALREAQEEIGIDPKAVNVLGALTSLYIPVSNSMVTPFIGFLTEKPVLQINHYEVKEVIVLELTLIRNQNIKSKGWFAGLNNAQIEAPYFHLNGHQVWGATAMMLSELEAILEGMDLAIE